MSNKEGEYWVYEGWSGDQNEPYRHWCKYPSFSGLYEEIWEFLKDELPIPLNPYRVIVNAYSHGDSSWLHKDSEQENQYTVILYLNTDWSNNWGGETILTTDGGEIILAVFPTPGRVIMFDGRILHGPRPVSREAPFPRIGVTFQCSKQ